MAIYKLGFTGHKQFEYLTCTTEGELARSVCCGDVGDEQYGILLKVLFVELLLYCCEMRGVGWVDGACSKVVLCAKCI